MDPDSKVIPTYTIGKRDVPTAVAFISDLASRLANRVQISSDDLGSYVTAIERAWGSDVDYAQIVKTYEAEPLGPGRYSPPKVKSIERIPRPLGAMFWQASLLEGVDWLAGNHGWVSTAHTLEDITATVAAFGRALRRLAEELSRPR